MTFALLVTILAEGVGVAVGAALGYFAGKLDILGQRVIEIWSSLPFLYTIIIVSSIIVPVYVPGRATVLQSSFWLLVIILSIFEWVSITYYIRGEFYREKARDYVAAAIATGVSEPAIMFRHILPNALTPVVSFAPFVIVANIGSLVALDFLGFGLPAPTPSWGELIGQGMDNLTKWWLVFFPLGALFLTLLLVVFIGEAVREAFDPKGVLAAPMTPFQTLRRGKPPSGHPRTPTHFFTEAGVVKAVDGVDLSIYRAKSGLVGESGSGKSVTALSVLRLIPIPPGRIVGGEIFFKGAIC
jgi:ABC-type microcin C transport system permease subunit YejE